MPLRAGATSTSRFGSGKRENHDAGDFYARFTPPVLSADDHVHGPLDLSEPLRVGDSRAMDLPDASVALVVTSPPYHAGKEYESALGEGHVPASYFDYLGMLRDVFAECVRVLEPGGRIAVNVANLGRRPYRSLAADVIAILQDDLGLLLRGEVVWLKAEGASGSCAWGSYRSAANPVLRDTTERVVIASKGRFDRALSLPKRAALGLPHRNTTTTDEFLDATLDVWRLAPESARRIGHPAPFPVELPLRVIELYTYEGDLVLDPFLGSGTTAVAAMRSGRRGVGFDTDADYVAMARQRVAEERDLPQPPRPERGASIASVALDAVTSAGFDVVEQDHRVRGAAGIVVPIVASDQSGRLWYFDVAGGFATGSYGLDRNDVLWRALGRASVLAAAGATPLVLLTSHAPRPRSGSEKAIRAVGPRVVFDVVELLDPAGRDRLATYASREGVTSSTPTVEDRLRLDLR